MKVKEEDLKRELEIALFQMCHAIRNTIEQIQAVIATCKDAWSKCSSSQQYAESIRRFIQAGCGKLCIERITHAWHSRRTIQSEREHCQDMGEEISGRRSPSS